MLQGKVNDFWVKWGDEEKKCLSLNKLITKRENNQMATDYNKPIFKVVDRPFYSIIDESANKLSDFKRELTYKDRFKAAFREVFPKTLDTIDEDISLGFCFDALKKKKKMKVVLSENSKESFGVLMLCLFVTTGDQFHVYEGLRD